MGVIQQKVNPLINKLIDYGILDKGESVTGVTKKTTTDKTQGRPAKEKSSEEPKAKKEKAEKPSKEKPESKSKSKEEDEDDELEKADKEYYSSEEEEFGSTEKEPSTKDVKAAEKEFGDVSSDKMEKFNTGLKFIKKYKDDKKIIDAYLKKAKDE